MHLRIFGGFLDGSYKLHFPTPLAVIDRCIAMVPQMHGYDVCRFFFLALKHIFQSAIEGICGTGDVCPRSLSLWGPSAKQLSKNSEPNRSTVTSYHQSTLETLIP